MKFAATIFVLFLVYQSGIVFSESTSNPAVLILLMVPLLATYFIYDFWIKEYV